MKKNVDDLERMTFDWVFLRTNCCGFVALIWNMVHFIV